MNITKLILDTDIGSEMTDAATFVLAATAPEIKLIGVTTVTDDTVFRASTAKKFLSLLSKSDIPVAAGAGTGGEHEWEKEILFPEGYKPYKLDTRPAAQLIVDLVNANPGVVLMGIGTTTNIAAALDIDPALSQKVSRLLLMGGMLNPPMYQGSKIPIGFEYNFCNDGSAIEKIMHAGFPITLLPGDVTFAEGDPWTESEMTELRAIEHPVVKILERLQHTSLEAIRSHMTIAELPKVFAQPWVNDELLISYLLQPHLFTTQDVTVSWERPDKYPRIAIAKTGISLTLIQGVDYTKTRRFILDRLKAVH